MRVSQPFQITELDIECFRTLSRHDIDKWALLVCDAIQLFDSEQAARECREYILS